MVATLNASVGEVTDHHQRATMSFVESINVKLLSPVYMCLIHYVGRFVNHTLLNILWEWCKVDKQWLP